MTRSSTKSGGAGRRLSSPSPSQTDEPEQQDEAMSTTKKSTASKNTRAKSQSDTASAPKAADQKPKVEEQEPKATEAEAAEATIDVAQRLGLGPKPSAAERKSVAEEVEVEASAEADSADDDPDSELAGDEASDDIQELVSDDFSGYEVAAGKSITSRRGILGPGQAVRMSDLHADNVEAAQRAIRHLYRARVLVPRPLG